MFSENFQLTKGVDKVSVFEVIKDRFEEVLTAGVYNNGLFEVLDFDLSNIYLTSWSWLLKDQYIPLIATGFGDVFLYHKNSKAIYFLEVQRGEIECIDSEIAWFINEFLSKQEIIKDLLRKEQLDELIVLHRPLNYNEAFILEPWLIFGGKDCVNNYIIGSCSVYIDLVGQTISHSLPSP